MKVKETIAFIGATEKSSDELVTRLAEKGYPLVLVSKPGDASRALAARIVNRLPDADLAVVDCERECCWEADIILLPGTLQLKEDLIEKIRPVAVQKILVRLSDAGHEREWTVLKHELPYTKLVRAYIKDPGIDVDMTGDDPESMDKMSTLFSGLGYTVRLMQAS